MQVQFNADESLEGREGLRQHAEEVVRRVLSRFGEQITRVEVHVSDVNGSKSGENDKRCLMEARLAGRQPIAVTELASSVHQALDGAAHKLKRSVDTAIGKVADRRPSPPAAEDVTDAALD